MTALPPPPIAPPEGHFMLIPACQELGIRVNHLVLARVGRLLTEKLLAQGEKPVVVDFGDVVWEVGAPVRHFDKPNESGGLQRACAYPDRMHAGFQHLLSLPQQEVPVPERWAEQDRAKPKTTQRPSQRPEPRPRRASPAPAPTVMVARRRPPPMTG